MGDVYILGKPSDPAAVARTPGVYMAPSSSPSYGVLRGLVAAGDANFVGETYLEDGQLAVTAEVSKTRRNAAGQIVIGVDFFASALRDYGDWAEKWWREAVQNAVDAGATEVDCVVTLLDEAGKPTVDTDLARSVEVSCQDNGHGMDEEVLLNKFLVLGGTTKHTGETVGGFGKAKELLLLPWLRWHMHSGDMIVEGHGIQYDIKHTGSSRRGTGITVWMPMDKHTTAADAQSFLKKCWIPGVRFMVNGAVVRANQKAGQLVESASGLDITYKKTSKEFDQPTCLVRVKGLYMFDQYIASDVKGVVIVEVTGPSIEILTANRDGLRDYEARRTLQGYLNRLAADVKTATKASRNIVKKKYEGTGKFEAKPDQVEAELLMSLASTEPADHGPNQPRTLSDEQSAAFIQIVAAFAGQADDDVEQGGLNLRAHPASAGAMLDVPVHGSAHVEAIAHQLAWEPDFFVYNEVEDFHVPPKFLPEKMTPQIRKLARFWAEMCRFVLIQLGSKAKYGVGWHFEDSAEGGYTAASYVEDGDEHWLMLNPFIRGDLKSGDLYSLTDRVHVNTLYAMAVHECTHMADGVSRHNEAFTTAFTYNVARTANRARQIEAIRKAVVARGATLGKLVELSIPRSSTTAGRKLTAQDLADMWRRLPERQRPSMERRPPELVAGQLLDRLGVNQIEEAIASAQRGMRTLQQTGEHEDEPSRQRLYAKAVENWKAAVDLLQSLAAIRAPAGGPPYTREELGRIAQETGNMQSSKMRHDQAAAYMLFRDPGGDPVFETGVQAEAYARQADEQRKAGNLAQAQALEWAAYQWQDASFLLKHLIESEGAVSNARRRAR